jgi:hypothetical protein
MTRPSKVLLSIYLCLTVGVLAAQTQNKSETLSPNASLPETLDWLKAHIPYSYLVPSNKEGLVRVLQRRAIGHVQNKGCILTYEVTIETREQGLSTSVDRTDRELEQQLWRIDLKGLNPRMIRVEPARGDRAARIVFSSFDPTDPGLRSNTEPGKAFVAPVVPNKTISHRDRIGDHAVRNGEGFVSWGSFSVRDEVKGQEIAAALKHVIGLCQ